jgi:Fe-S-cluster-containing dehydrogenase component
MKHHRRHFFKRMAAGTGTVLFGLRAHAGTSVEDFPGYAERFGLLMDLSLCIGCRKCEEACKQANQLPPSPVPLEDKSIFERERRTDAENYTVVNRYAPRQPDSPPVFTKKQCMHCSEPACASACLVGAFTKTKEGAVRYNKDICLGCRYCMIACPFSIPAYEYHNPTSPQVRKCTLCPDRVKQGEAPACASICPREAITFGKRTDLIKLAAEKMARHPGKYQDHLYGLNEAGGTTWLYLSEVPFATIGFPTNLGTKPFAEYTRGFLSAVPVVFVVWPALLGGFHLFSQSRSRTLREATGPDGASKENR